MLFAKALWRVFNEHFGAVSKLSTAHSRMNWSDSFLRYFEENCLIYSSSLRNIRHNFPEHNWNAQTCIFVVSGRQFSGVNIFTTSNEWKWN